jgi:hypothetical protein
MLVSLAATASACLGGEVIDRIERTLPAKDRPLIYVRNSDGRTSIKAAPGSEVRVVAIKETARNMDPEKARREAADIQVRIEQSGNRIEIEARYPKHTGTWNHGPEVLVHFEITAPPASDLDAHNSDGALIAEGFDGRIELSTSDGKLTATRCSGQLKVHVSDGEMRLEDIQGDLQAHSSDGKMVVDGTFKGLDVKSSDGNVDLIVRPGSTMERAWSIGSSDGSIHMRLPDSFDADLDVSTSDGSIRVDHPVTMAGSKLSEHHLAGKLNRGGQLMRVHSSDGSVTISK